MQVGTRHPSWRWRRRAAALVLGTITVATACGSSEPAPTATATASTAAGSTAGSAASTGTSSTAPPATEIITTTTSLPPPLPAESPPISSPGSNKLLVLGDSVILGAKLTIPAELKGWDVIFDASESRFITQGVSVLQSHKSRADSLYELHNAEVAQAYKDAGLPAPKPPPPPTLFDAIGRVVVISLCTNYEAGGGFANQIDRIMAYLKGIDRVVWVTCYEWNTGQPEANAAIKAAAATYPNLVVADWAAHSITPGYTYDDKIHLREEGQKQMARLVAATVGKAPTPPPPPPATTLPKPTTTTTTTPPPTEPPPEPAT